MRAVIAAILGMLVTSVGAGALSAQDASRSTMGDRRPNSDFLTAQPRASGRLAPIEMVALWKFILTKVKPHWQPPSGADVDALVSKVRFRLNSDGSLAGRPELVGQRGVNDVNRTQASRHGEQAIRAVQLAAPFDLPAEYYAAWKTVTLDFDWKLSQ